MKSLKSHGDRRYTLLNEFPSHTFCLAAQEFGYIGKSVSKRNTNLKHFCPVFNHTQQHSVAILSSVLWGHS